MLNLEKEIIDHPLRQLDPAIPKQAQNNEITVPPVHFIESSTWHYVPILEIEQSGRIKHFRPGLPEVKGCRGKMFDLNVTPSLKLFHRVGNREVGREKERGRRG
jgi:hypothetical protein